jgi:hypothetical protein
MQRYLRSLVRLSWATSLYGVERLGELLDGQRRNRLGPAVDAVTDHATSSMSETAAMVFWATEAIGREWWETLDESWRPEGRRRLRKALAARTADGVRFLSPSVAGSAARRELRNKFRSFWHVMEAERLVDVGRKDATPEADRRALESTIAQVLAERPEVALWTIEGLAYRYVCRALGLLPDAPRRRPPVEGLWRGELSPLLERLGPVLHLSLGMAIGRDALGRLSIGRNEAAVRRAVREIVAGCRRHARPSLVFYSFESLGLVTRIFRPALVQAVDRGVAASGDRELRRLYWHGVGRALYFAPVQLVPGYASFDHALELLRREVPADLHDDALSGLGYAFILVNARTPKVIENVLSRWGAELAATDFRRGAAAGLHMQDEVIPGSNLERALADHQPPQAILDLWRRCLGQVDPGRGLYSVLDASVLDASVLDASVLDASVQDDAPDQTTGTGAEERGG